MTWAIFNNFFFSGISPKIEHHSLEVIQLNEKRQRRIVDTHIFQQIIAINDALVGEKLVMESRDTPKNVQNVEIGPSCQICLVL